MEDKQRQIEVTITSNIMILSGVYQSMTICDQERRLYFLEVETDYRGLSLHTNAYNFLLMIPPASIEPECAFSSGILYYTPPLW